MGRGWMEKRLPVWREVYGTTASLAASKAFCFGYFPRYISYVSHLRIEKQFTYMWIYEEDVEEINKLSNKFSRSEMN